MATLRGHAVSGAAPGLGPAYEHTYVTSDDGYVWHCLGQSIGGRVLRFGSGSSAVADCVSHPRAPAALPFIMPVYAGLRYGRDGVCHQMANRILRSANIDVSGARLYRQGLNAYGLYGRSAWPQWPQCLSSSTVASTGPGGGSGLSGGSDDMAQTRIKERLDALYQRVQAEGSELSADYGDPRLRQAEFNVMIDEMLGADYDPQKRSRLLEIQASLGARQSYLDAALDNGLIAGDAYLARLREALDDTAKAYAAVLGHKDYVTLFGAAPDEASSLIDPSVLSTSPGTKTRRRSKRRTSWDQIQGN